MHDYLIPVYAIYLAATVGLCTWLARSLFTNGAVFLTEVFDDRPDLAQAVNRLLVTGFAMVNLGFGFFLVQGGVADDASEAIEVLARKLGILLVSLAVIHFANIVAFHWIDARRHPRPSPAQPVGPPPWAAGPSAWPGSAGFAPTPQPGPGADPTRIGPERTGGPAAGGGTDRRDLRPNPPAAGPAGARRC